MLAPRLRPREGKHRAARDAAATFDAVAAIDTEATIEKRDAGTSPPDRPVLVDAPIAGESVDVIPAVDSISDTIPDTQTPLGTPCRRASAVFEPGPYPRESAGRVAGGWVSGAPHTRLLRPQPGSPPLTLRKCHQRHSHRGASAVASPS